MLQKKKRKPKYYNGLLLQHKKYNFMIKLVTYTSYDRWLFVVVRGTLPSRLRPELMLDFDLQFYHSYHTRTLTDCFTSITSSKAGKLLYEN